MKLEPSMFKNNLLPITIPTKAHNIAGTYGYMTNSLRLDLVIIR